MELKTINQILYLAQLTPYLDKTHNATNKTIPNETIPNVATDANINMESLSMP